MENLLDTIKREPTTEECERLMGMVVELVRLKKTAECYENEGCSPEEVRDMLTNLIELKGRFEGLLSSLQKEEDGNV